MKDSLNTLFQQRFKGHEMPVDPGVWQGIQQQMASATVPAEDGVGKLFKERFQEHETAVDPSAWANISSQLGHPVVAGPASNAFWGWVTAGAAAVAVTAVVLLWEPAAPGVQKADGLTDGSPSTTVTVNPSPEMAPTPGPTAAVDAQVAGPFVVRTDAYPVRKTKTSATSVAQLPTPVESLSTGPEVSENKPSAQVDGSGLVTDIITDLTTQVIQQPVTAQPEPGLVSAVSAPVTNDGKDASVVPGSEIIEEEIPLPKLFMPNTFTPNGDLVNDTYTIGSEGFTSAMVRVYSMKSDRLVFSTNIGEPWTGAGCEDGMYLVAVEARTPDGRTATEGKVVWLNRNPIN